MMRWSVGKEASRRRAHRSGYSVAGGENVGSREIRSWKPEQQPGKADNRVPCASPRNTESFWKASGSSWGSSQQEK